MFSAPLILAGQLLGAAFACGLNLYATVALLGLSSRLGLVTHLPPGMRGLENGLVIGLAAGLYIIEFIADRIPVVDTAWEALHTLIRPAAAGFLTFIALLGAPFYLQAGGAIAAAAMALAAHASKAGIRLILATRARALQHPGRRQAIARLAISIVEDVIAIAIALAALLYPSLSVFIVAASIAVLLLAGPRLWRASLLGVRAMHARTRSLFGRPGWRTREQLPGYLRDAIPHEPLGRSPARATPAAVTGLPNVGAYRNGWLVFTCDGPRFLYRSLFRAHCLALPHITGVTLRPGIITDALDVRTDNESAEATAKARAKRSFTIFLLKDGAPPHIAAAELTD